MAHDAIFHQGLHSLQWWKQSSRTEIHSFHGKFDQQPLKVQTGQFHIKCSIKETVAFTKALHYDHSYYHTAFSLATHLSTAHMWWHRPKLAVHQKFGSHSPSPREESSNRLLLFLFSSCFIWMSLSVCVILLFYPLDAMKLYVMYVCGIFVRHVFCKAVLVFLSFWQSKTSGLVAHENSTFKNVNRSICVLYLVNGCSFGH